MTNENAILVVGPPGAGKGTNCVLLAERTPELFYFESGAIVRQWVQAGSPLAREYAPKLAKGEYLEDKYMSTLYAESIDRLVKTGQYFPQNQVLLLDGYPRTKEQAMDNDRLALRLIIELRVADTATLVGRITNDPKRAHRTDNDPSTILRRIDIYERNNKPLLEYYRRMRVPVQEIDASQPIGMVQQAMNVVVSKVLARYASRTSSLNLA